MSETPSELKIGERLERIEHLLVEILDRLEQACAPPRTPGDVLSLNDAAEYVGVKPSTLRDGKAGTKGIPRFRDRPVQFLRASLDQFEMARVEREARRMQESTRPRGLIRRRKIRRD